MYLEYITALLSDLPTARRQATEWRLRIKTFDDNWDSRLAEVNALIYSLQHQPQEIPVTSRSDSEDCRLLAQLHPSSLPQKINDLFPLGRAAKFHLKLRCRDITTYRDSGKEIFARIRAGVTRRLPKKKG